MKASEYMAKRKAGKLDREIAILNKLGEEALTRRRHRGRMSDERKLRKLARILQSRSEPEVA